MYKFLIFIVMVSMLGCRPTPFKVQTITPKDPTRIAPSERSVADSFDKVLKSGLSDRYKKANSPSFAIIKGFYRLPNSDPYGAATLVRGYSYQTYFESMVITKPEMAYAIEPLDGDDAMAYGQALNILLDHGVKFKEMSMSDALKIAKAESVSAKEKKTFNVKNYLAPDVDFLMSIYKTSSSRGPVVVGRVIKKDGSLLAFRVLNQVSGNNVISSLILSLFEDTVNRV